MDRRNRGGPAAKIAIQQEPEFAGHPKGHLKIKGFVSGNGKNKHHEFVQASCKDPLLL